MARMIDGEAFKSMMLEAVAAVEELKENLNALNVFPVPDGDTGTNMALTLKNAAVELSKLQSPSLNRVADTSASALLRGARGNSGVILSLLFRGISKVLKEHQYADGAVLAEALSEGAAAAYKAVMKPAEGTILTVAKVCGEAATKAARKNKAAEDIMNVAVAAAEKALAQTTDQNPVLKRAGVVDAGAYGYVIILTAMADALSGAPSRISRIAPQQVQQTAVTSVAQADFSEFDTEDITFAYCTEFIADRENKDKSPDELRDFLAGIGDCVVVVDDDEIIKIHVHTDNPDRALAKGLEYGRLSAIKIENMVEQHERMLAERGEQAPPEAAQSEKTYGFVAVGAGDGICTMFSDLGADSIVQGGQTMNPSTDDILRAVQSTPADVVFVLPNNKNIIMASQQAAALSQKEVVILPTKTVPQGICAMLSFDPDSSTEDNQQAMLDAIANVRTGQMTYAARDSEYDGESISQGDFLALLEGKLHATGKKFDDVMKKLAKSMCKGDATFVTIIYGEGAEEEQAEQVKSVFEKYAPDAEVNLLCGGQPVYSYIISVE